MLLNYGLSGSGQNFTLFGPDDPIASEAWFKCDKPHDLWGIFPRLSYDLLAMAESDWTIQMKYFQNIGDTVRDLLSPIAEEKKFGIGLNVYGDTGCKDLEWCLPTILKTWNDVRHNMKRANMRKNFFPTQFHHRSTHGHSILTLTIAKPGQHAVKPIRKVGNERHGRLYIFDVAGTEPAADIFHASYKKIETPDGSIEHNLLGPHLDPRLTEDLRFQHHKSRASLAELAQLFLKTAQAIKDKKLTRCGQRVRGCSSHFVCKFLKPMLYARSQIYLICAIRPEQRYSKYNASILEFARNVSAVKLPLQVPTWSLTEAETIERLGEQQQQERKSRQLRQLRQWQVEAYLDRGISLAALNANTKVPHFINVDTDNFRSRRFMFFVDPSGDKTFGKDADIRPLSMTTPKQCVVTGANNKFKLQAIAGQTYHNGKLLSNGAAPAPLSHLDRVIMGEEKCLFIIPAESKGELDELDPPIPEEVMISQCNQLFESPGGTKVGPQNGNQRSSRLLSQVQEVKKCCYQLNRETLRFEAESQHVVVRKAGSKDSWTIHPVDFYAASAILKDECTRMRLALEDDYEYHSPPAHDPTRLFMDGTYNYGTARIFTEYLQYQLETEEHDRMVTVKNSQMQTVCQLEIMWTPLASPDDLNSAPSQEMYNDTLDAIVGNPWTYKLEINRLTGLDAEWSDPYVEYTFWGETFGTESSSTLADSGYSFNYVHVHHVELVDRDFLNFLEKEFTFEVYATRRTRMPPAPVPSTDDPIACSRILGREMVVPGLDTMDKLSLQQELCKQTEKVRSLNKKVKALETKMYEADQQVMTAAAKLQQLPAHLPPRRATADAAYRRALQLAAVVDAIPHTTDTTAGKPPHGLTYPTSKRSKSLSRKSIEIHELTEQVDELRLLLQVAVSHVAGRSTSTEESMLIARRLMRETSMDDKVRNCLLGLCPACILSPIRMQRHVCHAIVYISVRLITTITRLQTAIEQKVMPQEKQKLPPIRRYDSEQSLL